MAIGLPGSEEKRAQGRRRRRPAGLPSGCRGAKGCRRRRRPAAVRLPAAANAAPLTGGHPAAGESRGAAATAAAPLTGGRPATGERRVGEGKAAAAAANAAPLTGVAAPAFLQPLKSMVCSPPSLRHGRRSAFDLSEHD